MISLTCQAQDFMPSLSNAPDTGKPYAILPASAISEQFYGISHAESSLSLTPVSLNSGAADIILSVNINPWISRSSEGIFFAEYWVEKIDPSTNAVSVASYSGVIAINVNSGTSASASWNWSTELNAVQYGTTFRVFGYCYMYNQGGGQQGEFALFSSFGSARVSFPKQMPMPTSSSATIVFGQTFTPSINSDMGPYGLVYQITGQTPLLDANNAWNPPTAGTYTFTVGQLSDASYYGNTNDPIWGNLELNSTPYTLKVTSLTTPSINSFNDSIIVGTPWSPTYTTTSPDAGPAVFCVVGETNFGTSGIPTQSWTPKTAGNYTFYVGQQILNSNYQSSISDPILGAMVLNFTPYTVTVLRNSQSVLSTNATVTLGNAFTPTFITNSASGSDLFQFCIINHTNYDGGGSQNQGTLDPSQNNTWVPSWTASEPGVYYFTVAENGNDQFSPYNPGTEYTLTVNAPPKPAPVEPVVIPQIPISPVVITPVISQPITPVIFTPEPVPAVTVTQVIAPPVISQPTTPVTITPTPTTVITQEIPFEPEVVTAVTYTTPVTPTTPIALVSTPPVVLKYDITRIRFNLPGHDAFITAPGKMGHISYIWTDPSLLSIKPWQVFSNPTPLEWTISNFKLPEAPLAKISNH